MRSNVLVYYSGIKLPASKMAGYINYPTLNNYMEMYFVNETTVVPVGTYFNGGCFYLS